jgi:hypothetical protein
MWVMFGETRCETGGSGGEVALALAGENWPRLRPLMHNSKPRDEP